MQKVKRSQIILLLFLITAGITVAIVANRNDTKTVAVPPHADTDQQSSNSPGSPQASPEPGSTGDETVSFSYDTTYSSSISSSGVPSLQTNVPSSKLPAVPEDKNPIGRYGSTVFNDVGSTKDITFKTRPAMKLVENSPSDYDLIDDPSSDVNLKLNMYYPQGDPLTERPLLIFVYGGGWWVGDRYQREIDAEYFASLGYVTMTIDYTMFPGTDVLNPLPTIDNSPYSKIVYESASDIFSAYQYALANKSTYGIDTSRIGVGGWSAGGMISQALVNLQALPRPYGVKAVLGLSNILPADLSDVFELTGGFKTYGSDFNPISMFASYDEDVGFAGTPNDHAADCAYLDSIGHNCITVTYSGSGHELDFSIDPALSTSVPFFKQYVAGY